MKQFVFIVFSVCCALAQNDLAVLGVGGITQPSVGQFRTGYWPEHFGLFGVDQSSAAGAGFSIESRHWWGKNGAEGR